jgi:hypothetical protein
MSRHVRFEDVYLIGFGDEHEAIPTWGPRGEACDFPTSEEAREAVRIAKEYEGKRADICVVVTKAALPKRTGA